MFEQLAQYCTPVCIALAMPNNTSVSLLAKLVWCAVNRRAALDVTKALVAHIQSPDALASEVTKARKILDGSAEGRVKSAGERAALAAFLTALSPAALEGLEQTAEGIASFLADFYT